MTISGKKCVAIIIGSHRYLVAIDDSKSLQSVVWWPNDTDDISEWVPYVRGYGSSGSPNIPASPVCNFSDYYELDKLTLNILVAAEMKNISGPLAARSVRLVTTGGLRWNLPNFEVMYYMFKNYSTFFDPNGTYKLGNDLFWLPYSNSISLSWLFKVNSSTNTTIGGYDRTDSGRILPVTTF
jgi:hypothetical protein